MTQAQNASNSGKAKVLDQPLKTSDKASCVGTKTETSTKWETQPPSGIALFKREWEGRERGREEDDLSIQGSQVL